MDEQDSKDIAWLIVAALGVAGAWRLWDLRLRPWVSEQWQSLTDSAGAGQLDGLVVDAVAVAVITLPVLVLLLLVRRVFRRRKQQAQV